MSMRRAEAYRPHETRNMTPLSKEDLLPLFDEQERDRLEEVETDTIRQAEEELAIIHRASIANGEKIHTFLDLKRKLQEQGADAAYLNEEEKEAVIEGLHEKLRESVQVDFPRTFFAQLQRLSSIDEHLAKRFLAKSKEDIKKAFDTWTKEDTSTRLRGTIDMLGRGSLEVLGTIRKIDGDIADELLRELLSKFPKIKDNMNAYFQEASQDLDTYDGRHSDYRAIQELAEFGWIEPDKQKGLMTKMVERLPSEYVRFSLDFDETETDPRTISDNVRFELQATIHYISDVDKNLAKQFIETYGDIISTVITADANNYPPSLLISTLVIFHEVDPNFLKAHDIDIVIKSKMAQMKSKNQHTELYKTAKAAKRLLGIDGSVSEFIKNT